MSTLERLEIHLQNGVDGKILAGETVHGKLIISLTRSIKIQGIEIKVRGRCHAEWREGIGGSERHLYETEEYIKDSIVIFGKEPQNDVPTNVEFIASGDHVFNFTFHIPSDTPSSFEGMHGYVRYWVKAKVYGVWGLMDQSGKLEFPIERTLDLNSIPSAKEAAEDEDSCIMCGCCLNHGSVSAFFRLSRRGFVPGEPIIFHAEIYNGSDSSIKSSKVKFYKIVTYGDSPMESNTREKITICELIRGKIKSGQAEVYADEFLTLPVTLPVTSLPGCSLIDVDYVIELKVTSAVEELNMRLPLLIIIGTVPFSDAGNVLQSPSASQIDILSTRCEGIPLPNMLQPLSNNPFESDVASFCPPTSGIAPMATGLDELYPPINEEISIPQREKTLDEIYGERRRPRLLKIMAAVNEGADLDDESTL